MSENNTAAVVLNDNGLATKEIVISKKVEGKYQEVGKVNIFIPLLDAFGFNAERGEDDDGLPTYKDEKAQYVFDAVVAAVKAKARNALVSGTADLKEGQKIAETLAEIMAAGERGGAEALANVRELKKAFAAWVVTLKKSQKATDQICGYFANREALSLMTEEVKNKMAGYVDAFMEQAEAELLQKGQKYLTSVIDACNAEAGADDDF